MSNRELIDAFVGTVRKVYQTNDFIPLHAPCFQGNEKELVLETLESTFVSSVGENVNNFEVKVAEYTGAKYAVAVSTGTAALHAALYATGTGLGDEVITSPLTFVATCNAVSYCGATPIFVDVDNDTFGLSPESLGEFLDQSAEVRDDGLCWNVDSNKIIRACIPVHNLGHPARIEAISEICREYRIVLIEDAAESLGSLYRSQHTGRVGKVGVLSFNGNKIITTGGGGAIITDDGALAQRLKHLTTTAKQPHPWLFNHDEVGFNYRLPNLNAALGLAQITQLDTFVTRKRNLADYYRTWFKKWSEARFVLEPREARSNYWLNAILLPDQCARDEFLARTNERGVMTRPMWTPMNTLPMYQRCQQFNLVNSPRIEARLVNIPSSAVSLN